LLPLAAVVEVVAVLGTVVVLEPHRLVAHGKLLLM
tara:strand:- start:119 stop:223 length:105 start_codon:yes stop_codon:yes gene_type:complete